MNKDLFLVINLGFRSIRIIVFDREGNNLIHNWYPVKTYMGSVFVEQDTHEWIKKLHTLFLELVDTLPELKENLVAITVTSSSNCLIPVNKNNEALYNCILVSDSRADKEAKQLLKDHPGFFSKNRNFLPIPSFQIPKILWLKEEEPLIYRKTHKFLSPNDFIIGKLTGKYVTDALNASKYYYDENEGHALEILNHHKINVDKFSDVMPIGHVVGPLKKTVRERYGFKKKVLVVQTTYDAICAFWGSGVSQDGDASNVVGTVSSLRALSPKHVNFKSNLLSQHFSKYNKYIVGGSNNLDGGLLEWAKNCFYGDGYPDKHIFSIMEGEASRSTVGARGLFFLPYLLGERSPFWDSSIRGSLFGLEKFHSREDIIRSLFESSCYMIKDMVSEVEKAGLKINNIRINGGVSQIELICQLRADIIGKEILVLKEKESTAVGAFLLMLNSLGYIKGVEEFPKFVEVRKTFYPDKEKHKIYNKLYPFFKFLYRKSKMVAEKRKDLLTSLKSLDTRYTVDNM